MPISGGGGNTNDYTAITLSRGGLDELKALKKPLSLNEGVSYDVIRQRACANQFATLQYIVNQGFIKLPGKNDDFYINLVPELEKVEGSLDKYLSFLKLNDRVSKRLIKLIEPKLMANAEVLVSIPEDFFNSSNWV